jgi:hypothetical protein
LALASCSAVAATDDAIELIIEIGRKNICHRSALAIVRCTS